MKYISAYALLALADKTPSKDDVKKVLASVGAEVDNAELDRVFAQLQGKQLHELISGGMDKLATFSSGPAAGGAVQTTAAAPAETKKEAAKKEAPKEEEEVNLGGGGLFGDDDEWWKIGIAMQINCICWSILYSPPE